MTSLTEADIVQGLRNREFILFYQPKISLITNRIVGAEALARWRRADGAMVPPAAFIDTAHRSGLLKALTMQLLEQLVRDINGVLSTDLCISFNVSVADFQDDALCAFLLDAIDRSYLPPACLELEITETQALESGSVVPGHIHALVEAGVGLAMDDYGVGYSSNDVLSQWPFTTIKLDRGVIGRMLTDGKNATIVRSTIRLGHELGLEVVAEGVETPAQRDFLVEAGCKMMQGYLLSPALSLDDFQAFRHHAGDRSVPIGLVHMAIIDHVQWRRQMVSYAVQRATLPPGAAARQSEGYPQLCISTCALGRWYFGEGRHFATSPTFQAIDSPHRELHRIGEELVRQVRKGATLADLAGLLSTMKAMSTGLIRLLEDLEDIGLRTLYEEAPAIAHGPGVPAPPAP